MNNRTQEAAVKVTKVEHTPSIAPPELQEFAVCTDTRQLSGPGKKTLRLTRLEARLVAYLAEHPDREVCKSELLCRVWHYSPETTTHTVETHVWRLRQKVESLFPGNKLVRTGSSGYAFDRPVNAIQDIIC